MYIYIDIPPDGRDCTKSKDIEKISTRKKRTFTPWVTMFSAILLCSTVKITRMRNVLRVKRIDTNHLFVSPIWIRLFKLTRHQAANVEMPERCW